ncbi:MAG: P1 family peptidase [Acidobacteria bacterium]|nr:P1 family peptidase [Acidobacteriota bacterium]
MNRRTRSLTDIDGLRVGHYTCTGRPTGCTVILADRPFAAGVDVRGGAPGSRELELLRPENSVGRVDAVFLAGGSAFGLEAATGIMRWLEEQGRGFAAGEVRVPIVCGAILFDLQLGDGRIRPDAAAGYAAMQSAGTDPVGEGNVGAGAGATVGKMFGPARAMRGGLGSWSVERPDGLKVGALAAVNSFGDVVDPGSGRILAGARTPDGRGLADSMEALRRGEEPPPPGAGNTLLAVVATNADLSKSGCTRVARMAQDALARCIRPAHMPWDGDTVFALATGTLGRTADAGTVGALAADALATAILRAVRAATSWGGCPSASDFGDTGDCPPQ